MTSHHYLEHCELSRLLRRRVALALSVVLILSFLLNRGSASAEAGRDFQLIVHPENPITNFDREFVTDVYLKRVTRWGDGENAYPVDQRPDAMVRRQFSDSILKRSVAAMKRYWQQRIFSGRDLPPPELDSDEAVVHYVLRHRGAVGYVSSSTRLERAKPVPIH